MATIALPRPTPHHRPSSGLAALPSNITIEDLSTPTSPRPTPIPNKHIPVCPPGPVPQQEPSTPPASPILAKESPQTSLLSPPDAYDRIGADSLTVFKIDAAGVAAALEHLASRPLPDPSQVFPWLHGLHPQNHVQQAFFVQRRRALRRTPGCLRGITIVKADGDLAFARLKGALAPNEFMKPGSVAEFIDVDPREGFSVRNFQIQAAKVAMTSDIIVYGDDRTAVQKVGFDIASAQLRWKDVHIAQEQMLPHYNTFICTASFREFENHHPHIVAVDASGNLTGKVIDFFHQEQNEMYDMTKASEISHNVWLGPTPDQGSEDESFFDLLIECSDSGRLDPATLQSLSESREERLKHSHVDFPSSGSILPPTWSQSEADGILETCKWLYHLAHGSYPQKSPAPTDADGDTNMEESIQSANSSITPRRILIHCADGYTESTLLGIAYLSFSTGQPIPDAWLRLHTELKRNFFAYPTDVALLSAIAPRLLSESPVCSTRNLADITARLQDEPRWFAGLDGSLPSRVLDYMYLGNLGHANNPELLKAMGITQILSVGETAMWREGEREDWGEDNICVVQGVQDNGIDPLTEEFERCLEFIDRGRRKGTATLVHCRVGVSRSATICIAEVMRTMNYSLPQAYCFVRARRLNVIIQPHLRFAYELLKWEETLQARCSHDGGSPGRIRRELEWGEIAREIALMNRPYAR